jgi:hypothetical protein
MLDFQPAHILIKKIDLSGVTGKTNPRHSIADCIEGYTGQMKQEVYTIE